jgi:Na+/phosphate symporter
MGTIVLLDLVGGVALLLWGLHMVQSGILRAFGPQLRRLFSKALDNRIAAFLAGGVLTALLQSSTATGFMTASFAAEGLVALVPALVAAEVSRMDDGMDRLDEAIRLYLTKLTRGSLDEQDGQRAMQIISFAINLEHVGDIIDKNLSELALKKTKGNLQFSSEGAREIAAFHR